MWPKSRVGSRIFYGWLIVAAAAFAMLVSTGARNSTGVFIIPMSGDLEWSRGAISLAIAIGWLVNGLSQPFIGRLYDRLGGRKVILTSLFVLGAGTLLLARTSNIAFFIVVYGVVMSVAASGVSLVTVHAVLARWFRRNRGVALSISTAGASAGSLVLVPLAMLLIQTADWRLAWTVLGALVLGLALPLAFVLLRDSPAQMGLQPDGDSGPTGASGPPSTRASQEARGPLEVDRWRDSYKSLPMWQLTGGYFVCGMTTAIISAHYVPFAIERGASPGVAALAFGVMSGLNVLGVLMVGAWSDRLGRKNLLGATYAVRGLAYAMLLLAPGPIALWGFAIVAGFSWIATAPLTSSLTAEVYGLKHMGTLAGMVTLAHQTGGALSVYMGGALYDAFGSYTVPFAIAGSLLAGASLASFSIRESKFSIKYRPQPAATPAGDGGA